VYIVISVYITESRAGSISTRNNFWTSLPDFTQTLCQNHSSGCQPEALFSEVFFVLISTWQINVLSHIK